MATCTEAPPDGAERLKQILLVEDDTALERILRTYFRASGYEVASAGSAAEARLCLHTIQPDLILLDLTLPDVDGLVLLTSLQALTRAPIIICSARQGQVARVVGLKLGAADFIAKPFDIEELEARIEAVLRRTTATRAPVDVIRVGDLVVSAHSPRVTLGDRPVHLTPVEYQLLAVLASDPGVVFTREALIDRVWGHQDPRVPHHLVDVHVGRLRSKLRAVSRRGAYVVTARGRGYRLRSAPDPDQGD